MINYIGTYTVLDVAQMSPMCTLKKINSFILFILAFGIVVFYC